MFACRSAVEAAAVVKGDAKRQEAKSLEQQAKADEEAYLTRAHANRDRARSWTLSARKSVRAVARVKARAASRERANDILVTEEKLRIRASNRREVCTCACAYAHVHMQRMCICSVCMHEEKPTHPQ